MCPGAFDDDDKVIGIAAGGDSGLLLWQNESFAYADSYDEAGQRFRGLRCGKSVPLDNMDGVLVKPEVALRQQTAEAAPATESSPSSGSQPAAAPLAVGGSSGATTAIMDAPVRALRRFHGTVTLDAMRVGRDAGRIADEVISHLAGVVGAQVTVTLEIEALLPSGASDQLVRTVTENSRTLKFTSQGFEED